MHVQKHCAMLTSAGCLESAVHPEGEGNKSRYVAPYMEEACVQKLFEVADDSQVD